MLRLLVRFQQVEWLNCGQKCRLCTSESWVFKAGIVKSLLQEYYKLLVIIDPYIIMLLL